MLFFFKINVYWIAPRDLFFFVNLQRYIYWQPAMCIHPLSVGNKSDSDNTCCCHQRTENQPHMFKSQGFLPIVQHDFTVLLVDVCLEKLIFVKGKHNLESKSFPVGVWVPKRKGRFGFFQTCLDFFFPLSFRNDCTCMRVCVCRCSSHLCVFICTFHKNHHVNISTTAQGWVNE